MDTTNYCWRCESYAHQVHDLERRVARMTEALEAVVADVAPLVHALPMTDRKADKALAEVEAALLLKGGSGE